MLVGTYYLYVLHILLYYCNQGPRMEGVFETTVRGSVYRLYRALLNGYEILNSLARLYP